MSVPDATIFHRTLLRWYRRHARDLPWRKTHDPYAIAVSELMLQQTQVDRVIPKFHQWMKLFPTINQLAGADTKSILAAWQGLGYNRRALYLQRMAQTIVKEHDGNFPDTLEGLRSLPGIGPYTASAIASFAFHQPVPLVDTNVKRVLGRIFVGWKKLEDMAEPQIWKLATDVLPKQKKHIYDYNQSLMDFGATICTATKPKCEECPLSKQCKSYPSILQAERKQLLTKAPTETQYFGKPRRIWRGKILKLLHDRPKGKATLLQIGKSIQPDFTTDRIDWLRGVVATMEKDGLVVIKNKTVRLP